MDSNVKMHRGKAQAENKSYYQDTGWMVTDPLAIDPLEFIIIGDAWDFASRPSAYPDHAWRAPRIAVYDRGLYYKTYWRVALNLANNRNPQIEDKIVEAAFATEGQYDAPTN
jgi:hypothetical protein